jgi:hypothetical protein
MYSNFNLFNIVSHTLSIQNIGSVTYNKASPQQNIINVLKDFPWKNSGDVEEVPHVYVTEYELTWGQTVTNIQRVMQLIGSESDRFDPYYAMYTGKPTGFRYVFPHLIKNGDMLRSTSHQWNETAQTTMKGVTEGFFNAADEAINGLNPLNYLPNLLGGGLQNALIGNKVASNIPAGVGAEEVRNYSGTGPLQITINFPLYNTIDTYSAYRNFSLVSLLNFQNLKTRTTFMSYIPPKIYKVENSYMGGVYIPLGFISKLDIKSIGTTRVLKEYGPSVLIPEAYNISITFQELVSQSSNIYEGVLGGSKVEVIAEGPTLENILFDAKEIFNNLNLNRTT